MYGRTFALAFLWSVESGDCEGGDQRRRRAQRPSRRQRVRQTAPEVKMNVSEVASAKSPQPPEASAPPAASAMETTE